MAGHKINFVESSVEECVTWYGALTPEERDAMFDNFMYTRSLNVILGDVKTLARMDELALVFEQWDDEHGEIRLPGARKPERSPLPRFSLS